MTVVAPDEPKQRLLRTEIAFWFLIALATRIAFAAKGPQEWDSVQLTLGVDRFDVTTGSPHAPGYWVWVTLGKLVRNLTPLDAHESLILLSAVACAGTVVFAALVGREIGDRWLGAATALFLVCSPYMWFYGAIVATYCTDSLVGLALLYLAVKARPHSPHGVIAVAVLALGCGFRTTMLIVFGPLAAVAFVRSVRTYRQMLAAALLAIVLTAAWVIPLVLQQPGGWTAWRETSAGIFEDAMRQTSVLVGPPGATKNFAHAFAYTVVGTLPLFVLASVAVLVWLVRDRRVRRPGWSALALALAIVPPLAFVVLVHFAKAGYVLAYLPGLVLLTLWPVTMLRRTGRVLATVAIVLISGVYAQRFIAGDGILPKDYALEPRVGDTDYFSRSTLRRSDLGAPYTQTYASIEWLFDERAKYRELRNLVVPGRDVIVYVEGNAGIWYRHGTYEIPDIETVFLSGGQVRIKNTDGVMRFVTEDHVTVGVGGRAFFVLDYVYPDLQSLVDTGEAEKVSLRGGPSVWAVRPGNAVQGVPITTR